MRKTECAYSVLTMDPICHTLVGAALAESGLKRRTSLGTATLLIGANLPDVDLVSLLWGTETAVWFRRGITHGIPAMIILPLALTGLLMAWNRFASRRSGEGGEGGGGPQFRAGGVLSLAFIAVATHPVLDLLNVYGMRWLFPLSERWHYGDTLFIIDPWVWAILAAGIFLARRGRGRTAVESARPAQLAFAVFAIYVAVMAGSNWAGRRFVTRVFARRNITATRMMVAPVAVNPFRRWVVVESENRYYFGTLHWLPSPRFEPLDLTYEKFPSTPVASAATRGPKPRRFLSWARFPYDQVEETRDEYIVKIGDARYTLDPDASWGATAVRFGK